MEENIYIEIAIELIKCKNRSNRKYDIYVVHCLQDDNYYELSTGKLSGWLHRSNTCVHGAWLEDDIIHVDRSIPRVQIANYENSLAHWCETHGEWGKRLADEYADRRVSMSEVSSKSAVSILWKCSEGHEWCASLHDRVGKGRGCRICSGHEVSELNSLKSWCDKNGEWGKRLLAEYSSKNPKSVHEISYGSNDKVIWVCSVDSAHEWAAIVRSRTNLRSGCKYCSKIGTSYPEQFIYWSFKLGFPELSVSNRIKIQGFEADIYVKGFSINGLILEYNGETYHENKIEHDTMKLENFKKRGYRVLVIEEVLDAVSIGCRKIDDNTIRFSMNYSQKETCLQNLIKYLFNILGEPDKILKLDFEKINLLAYKHSTGSVEIEKSLIYLYPNLVKQEWSFERNSISPENIRPHSAKSVWWSCSKCGQSHEMRVMDKVRGIACKNCGWSFMKNRYVKKFEKSVLDEFPMLAEEFDTGKNPGIRLTEFSKGSNQIVVWTCKICGHTWDVSIKGRVSGRTACPKCRYSIFIKEFKSAKPGSNLKVKDICPEIFDEFAEDLNTISKEQFGELTTGSNKRIAFRCEKCGNEDWHTTVNARVYRKSGCLVCGWNVFEQLYKVSKHKTICEEYPQLLDEFDEKLNDISVEDFFNRKASADKRVLWRCASCKRVWGNTIDARVRAQSGCKKCGFNIFKAEKSHLGPPFNSDLQKEVLVITDDTGDSIDLEENWTEEEIQSDLESNHGSNEKDFTDIVELYKRRHKKGGTQ